MDATDKLTRLVATGLPLLKELTATDQTLGMLLAFVDGAIGGSAGAAALIDALDPDVVDRGLAYGLDLAARLRGDDSEPLVVLAGRGSFVVEDLTIDADGVIVGRLVAPVLGPDELALAGALLGCLPGPGDPVGPLQLGEVATGSGDLRGGEGSQADRGSAGLGDDEGAGSGDVPRPTPAA
jgi:hypothetical protein